MLSKDEITSINNREDVEIVDDSIEYTILLGDIQIINLDYRHETKNGEC